MPSNQRKEKKKIEIVRENKFEVKDIMFHNNVQVIL